MTRIVLMLGINRVTAIIMAHSAISLPYVFMLVTAGLNLLPKSYEEAAFVLGANKFNVIRKVILPLLKPHIFAGMMFAFITSFGEFIIAYMLSGPRSQLLTVYIYGSIRERTEPSISALLTLFTAVVIIISFLYSRYYVRKAQKS